MTRKKVYLMSVAIMICIIVDGQITGDFEKAYQKLLHDSSVRSATVGFLVIDALTNDTIISKNELVALAPASTQKILTSIAGFEILGGSYRYKTKFGYEGKIDKGTLKGNLVLVGTGDPTLGSWRWRETMPEKILSDWVNALKKAGVKTIQGTILPSSDKGYQNGIPGGWIWDDIGNYYGAGSYAINWKENQYDIILQSENHIGGKVKIINSKPASIMQRSLRNELTAAEKGSGDNAYIYFPVVGNTYTLRGTIPAGEKNFSISGASHDPAADLITDLRRSAAGILYRNSIAAVSAAPPVILHTTLSPPFDSINYWFMRKSINLYGEAIIKTIATENRKRGSTEQGVEILTNFWISKGIEQSSLQLLDGSGLSPQNRTTVKALVHALQYARKQIWFPAFRSSLPVINNMTMKSGSIGGARSYAGYHTSNTGKQYIFAIIVNNYSGSSAGIVRKIFALLDLMK